MRETREYRSELRTELESTPIMKVIKTNKKPLLFVMLEMDFGR